MTSQLHSSLQALEIQLSPSPLQHIHDEEFRRQGVELWIKRDDLLHSVISGNKWRKLKYILNHALQNGVDTIVSMGGAYSNHLHALAFVAKNLGLNSVGLIRGERLAELNPTLRDLEHWGMELRFVSRSGYRQLRNYRQHDSLPTLKPGHYWLPEGGATELALRGASEVTLEIAMGFDVLVVACGTGTTLAGLIAAAPRHVQLMGIAALKGAQFLDADVKRLLGNRNVYTNWQILLDYHHGGFARTSPALLAFMNYFWKTHGIALDPVYTGKMVFAVYDLLKKGYFKPGQRVVMLHTGGLQGTREPDA